MHHRVATTAGRSNQGLRPHTWAVHESGAKNRPPPADILRSYAITSDAERR